jgi:ketosteroid isomerase-like protein
MSGHDNVDTIKAVYEAFARGDVGFIADCVTDDVDWATETSSDGAPWYGPHTGKKGVGEFFEQFGKAMEVEEFTPLAFATTDDGDVTSVVRFTARSRDTGKVAAMDLHHWFRFTNGKISYYRGTEDTAITAAALR